MWPHFCPCEGTILWVGPKEACNWCGLSCESLDEPAKTETAARRRDAAKGRRRKEAVKAS